MYYIFVALIITLFLNIAFAGIPMTEMNFLKDFHDNMGGTNWASYTPGWSAFDSAAAATFCDDNWGGVMCNLAKTNIYNEEQFDYDISKVKLK